MRLLEGISNHLFFPFCAQGHHLKIFGKCERPFPKPVHWKKLNVLIGYFRLVRYLERKVQDLAKVRTVSLHVFRGKPMSLCTNKFTTRWIFWGVVCRVLFIYIPRTAASEGSSQTSKLTQYVLPKIDKNVHINTNIFPLPDI